MSAAGGRCQWPIKRCSSRETKLYELTNGLGALVRVLFCEAHATLSSDSDGMRSILGKVWATWDLAGSQITPSELGALPAQHLLTSHEELCEQCAAERDWLSEEMQMGRIKTPADFERLGYHAVTHCCAVGIELRRQIGAAMEGAV